MPPLSSSELLADFPQAWGNRMVAIVDHKGPNPYVPISPGTPPTGGDVVTAAECGMKFISAVYAGLTDDGTYNVEATPGIGAESEVTQVRLIWIIANTGAQLGSVNVSARTIRLLVIGR